VAFEEVTNHSNEGDFAEREFVTAKIGTVLEGTFAGNSGLLPSKFGGEYRIYNLDLTDGRKVAVSAGKILLERLSAANLEKGNVVRIEVESATSKQGREYALPRVFVDRSTTAPAVTGDPFAGAETAKIPF
jgi:hypothetical protein